MEFTAKNGHIQAQLQMADWHKEGSNMEKDMQKYIEYLNMAVNSGSSDAQYKLALVYLESDTIDPDYTEAYSLFKQANDQGHKYGQNIFRILIVSNPDIKRDVKIVEMFIEITEKGIADLHYHIGSFYEHGLKDFRNQRIGVNYTEAKKWYKVASKKGDSRADYRLGLMYEYREDNRKRQKIAMSYYEKTSEKGNADATYRLAFMYLHDGVLFPKELESSHYFSAAYTMGHQKASEVLTISKHSNVIWCCHDDLYSKSRLEISSERKIRMLEKAVKKGYIQLQHQIGVWYQNNRDYRNAIKWLQLAANVGVTDAYFRLGTLYEEGKRVKQGYETAVDMYQEAIRGEHEGACYRLGHLYHYGKVVEFDYSKAYHFYKKAADMGHADAQKILSIILEVKTSLNETTGRNFYDPASKEHQDSLLLLKHAAIFGDIIEAGFQVGFAYEHGVLTPEYEEAYKWYSMAAKESHREATYRLGLLYDRGLGIDQDYQLANQLYQQAGKLCSDNAIYQLSNAYHHGKGVEVDSKDDCVLYTFSRVWKPRVPVLTWKIILRRRTRSEIPTGSHKVVYQGLPSRIQ
jgi:TPR repeat protein